MPPRSDRLDATFAALAGKTFSTNTAPDTRNHLAALLGREAAELLHDMRERAFFSGEFLGHVLQRFGVGRSRDRGGSFRLERLNFGD